MFLEPIQEKDRLTIRRLTIPDQLGIILAAVHHPSKVHWDEQSQALECVELATSIRDTEERIGHSRTVLVGDLNMNPFEDGVVSANGLHSVMTKGIASKKSRIVQERTYPFFYNPMWGMFGDITPGPPGTYYYPSSVHRAYFWNIFDQVMVRPDLIARFPTKSLRVLDFDGTQSLLTSSGIPNEKRASDHLPLYFELNLDIEIGGI